MFNIETKRDVLKTSAAYVCLIVSSLLILVVVRQLWKADLKVPIYYYQSDPLCYSAVYVKGMIDNGWYLKNPYLGMPFGASMYDYPDLYNFDLLEIRIITLFVHGWAFGLNIFLISTFPFTAVMSMLVMRTLKVSTVPAFVASLLFTFIPYHLVRGVGHLFLSDISSIPIAVLLCLWVATDDQFPKPSRKYRSSIDLGDRRIICAALICIYVSSAAVYYVFFTCFFLCIAGVIGSARFHSLRRMAVALVLVGAIAVGFAINIMPSLLHAQDFSTNTEISKRSLGDAEVYGLKIIQLLLPAPGHRIPLFAKINAKYSGDFPLVNENSTSSLGIIGSLGFILLIVWLFRRSQDHGPGFIDSLSLMNLSAVLLGTIGGGGAIIALAISPHIRAYNRISVFIAFFCFLAAASVVDLMLSKMGKSPKRRLIIPIIAMLVLGAGIMDQTNGSSIPDYKATKNEYQNDERFIAKIEATVEPNAMIFQLPYIPFLVNPTVYKMATYDLLKGYAHSNALRWSYGIMGGSYGDRWQQQVSSQPMDELIESISIAGFSGIYIDRYGYVDNGASLEEQISNILGVTPIVSDNQRLSFYDLHKYNDVLRAGYTEGQWRIKKEKVLYPVDVSWKTGFSILEGTAEDNWRWSSSDGVMALENYSSLDRTITIKMYVATNDVHPSTIRIRSKDFSDAFQVSSEPRPYSRTVVIPPGEYRIEFVSDAKPADVLAEFRKLNFYIKNFRIIEE